MSLCDTGSPISRNQQRKVFPLALMVVRDWNWFSDRLRAVYTYCFKPKNLAAVPPSRLSMSCFVSPSLV